MTRRPEQAIQAAIVEHLRLRAVSDLFWFHVPNGGFRSPVEAMIFKSLGTIAGVPDLIFIYDGQAYGLELKAEGGRLTSVQSAVHEAMGAAGAEVVTAVGVDAALAQLETWGFLR
jgi:hypothetical protein